MEFDSRRLIKLSLASKNILTAVSYLHYGHEDCLLPLVKTNDFQSEKTHSANNQPYFKYFNQIPHVRDLGSIAGAHIVKYHKSMGYHPQVKYLVIDHLYDAPIRDDFPNVEYIFASNIHTKTNVFDHLPSLHTVILENIYKVVPDLANTQIKVFASSEISSQRSLPTTITHLHAIDTFSNNQYAITARLERMERYTNLRYIEAYIMHYGVYGLMELRNVEIMNIHINADQATSVSCHRADVVSLYKHRIHHTPKCTKDIQEQSMCTCPIIIDSPNLKEISLHGDRYSFIIVSPHVQSIDLTNCTYAEVRSNVSDLSVVSCKELKSHIPYAQSLKLHHIDNITELYAPQVNTGNMRIQCRIKTPLYSIRHLELYGMDNTHLLYEWIEDIALRYFASRQNKIVVDLCVCPRLKTCDIKFSNIDVLYVYEGVKVITNYAPEVNNIVYIPKPSV